MRRTMPQAVLAVVADHASKAEKSHAALDSLFTYAGCPGDPPAGSMHAKALAWLRATNADPNVNPLEVLGRVVEAYMDTPVGEGDWLSEQTIAFRAKLNKTLSEAGLQYRSGGVVTGSLGAPTRSLQSFINERDVQGISDEFERAASKAESEPREAVSAAANILESLCKHYIEQEGLQMPAKQVLGDLWGVVRKDLGFDPSQIADDDLKGILAGLIQVVHSVAAFRTHASSAHGAGPKAYRMEPRHSRLAVHAAHTVALFVLESWDKKKKTKAAAA